MLKKFDTSLNPGPERWEKISKIYDFTDKCVADIGCWNGYFSMKIGKFAESIFCYDKHPVKFASDYNVVEFDLDHDIIPDYYDTIVFLDTLQYVEDPELAIKKIFLSADDIIIEIFFNKVQPHWFMLSRKRLLELTTKYKHKLKTEFELERGSTVMLFEKC